MRLLDVEREFQEAEARMRSALSDPEAAQEELLLDIVRVNRDTEYGRRFDFASITDLRTYRDRVPLISYGDIAPYVDRMVEGAPDVLFEGPATFFGVTSGTTAAPKWIGFNSRVRNEYVHMVGPVVASLERDHPGASRTALLLTAKFEESRSPAGVPIGNGSGFVRRCLDEHPYFRFVPEVVYESRDPEARGYTLLLFALMRPMRCFASLFPILLINLFRRANELAGPLADDLERGTLEAGPPGIRAFAADCAPRLRPMPGAARRLRDIVRTHGRFVPDEYWPDVSVLHVWKGGTAKHALPELQALFPRAEIRPLASGSTEASLLVPLEGSWSGGVPALRSTVTDFLPAGAPPHPAEVVTLRDLEEGRGYCLVVTNHRGLYRYVMEDVFFVEGYYHGVPFLRLDHRVGIVSSLAGEKVTEAHASHAIEAAIAATGIELAGFQIAPEQLSGNGPAYRYAAQVELRGSAPPELLRRFLAVVEADMMQNNAHYVVYRNLGALGPAVLYRMRPGHFDGVLRARSAATGRTDVQFKLVALGTELLVLDAAAIAETVSLE